MADLEGFVLDLFQGLFVQIVAEIFQGLLLDRFAAEHADDRVVGCFSPPVARHCELARKLAGGLAQFLVNVGCIQLDVDPDLAVF